jgi:hypothetical protein
MKPIFYFVIVVLMLSCSDDESTPSLAGQYTGTFYRTRDNVRILESAVTLSFDEGKFSGGGADHHSPAICNGTYSMTENEINFNNRCFFTANFDWTLILSGTFVILKTDDTILFAKEIDSSNGDYYALTKVIDPR